MDYGIFCHDSDWRWNDNWDLATDKDSQAPLHPFYTPIFLERDEHARWGNTRDACDKANKRIATITCDEFLNTFLPVPAIPPKDLKRLHNLGHLSKLSKDGHADICKAFNATLDLAKSTYVLKDVAPKLNPSSYDSRPPDLALYDSTQMSRDAYTLPPSATTSGVPKERLRHRASIAWAWMVITVEIGHHWGSTEPPRRPQDYDTWYSGNYKRISNTYYNISQVLLHQHRQHGFSVFFCHSSARLARWDRAGVVLSHAIDVKKNPEQILDFVHRLGRLTREQQGYDPTAELAKKPDLTKLMRYSTPNEHLRRHRENMVQNMAKWPIYKIHCDPIPSANDSQAPTSRLRARKPRPKAFLVGKPLGGDPRRLVPPSGKNMRAYIAFDIAENRLVFLKDHWRYDAPDFYSESSVYMRLQKHDIQYVATAIAGGDVGGATSQTTETQEYLEYGRPLVHHVLVLKEVCRPLETYSSSPELIIATYHAFLAHRDCWKLAGVLHCDISHNNIMIDVESEEPKGILLDWDICTYREEMEREAGKPQGGAMGTQPFHSCATLHDPNKQKDVADDNESYIYLLLYMALRFHPHSLTCHTTTASDNRSLAILNRGNDELASHIQHLFTSMRATKMRFIQKGRPPIKMRPTSDGRPPLLAVLLRKLYKILQEHTLALILEAEVKRKARNRKINLEKKKQPPAPPLYIDPLAGIRRRRIISEDSEKPSEEELKKRRLERMERDARKNTPKAARRVAVSVRMKKARRLLDTHDAMIDAFRSVIMDDKGKLKIFPFPESDKSFDQFLHLPTTWGVTWVPTSIPVQKRNTSSDDADPPETKRPAKRRKL